MRFFDRIRSFFSLKKKSSQDSNEVLGWDIGSISQCNLGRHQYCEHVLDEEGRITATCLRCAVKIVIGEHTIDVSGTNSDEVEKVSKALLAEIAEKIEQEKLTNNEEALNKDQELKNILELIKQGELKDAIEKLVHFCEQRAKKYYEEALGYSSRYSSIARNNRKGIISNEENQREEARLTNSVLELISLIMKE